MSHYSHFPPEDDPTRLYIRQNRRKILFFLGIGVLLLIAGVIALVVFFFGKFLPAGTDAAKQLAKSDAAGGVKTGFQQLLSNFTLPPWLLTLVQLKN